MTPDLKVFDNNVGKPHQAPKKFFSLLVFQVQGDRTLSGVLGEKGGTHLSLVKRRIGSDSTCEIANARKLDLNNLGSG